MSTQRPSQRTKESRNTARTPQSESFRKRAFLATALALMVAPIGFAQTAAPAPSAADLAKYDTNHDGVLDVSETSAMDAALKKAGSTKVVKTEGEDTIELSPFIVNEDNNKGYEGTNTMSGSRLNTKLDDVAASISVVTKAQLLDFAATDINDIFAMEANTEGTRTYTGNSNDGKGDVDSVSNSPQTANRVRGLGSANIASGNFGMSTSIPIDTYNVDGVEISRGANSSIFGVGEGSGTVNLIPSMANLTKDRSSFSIGGSSYGTKRGTIDLNRVLYKGVVAFRINALAEDKGFVRKPSSDKTLRATFSLTYKPFKYTTIRASYEHFDERYSRPNSVTAKDYISIWNAAGQPIYDQTIAVVANRAVNQTTNTTPYTALQYMYVSSNLVRPTMFIDKGQVQHFTASTWYVPTTYTAGVPSAWSTNILPYFDLPTAYNVPFAYAGNSTTGAGIGYDGVVASTDKNFYDYTSINLAALNYGIKKANFGRIELEQFFLNTEHHMLAAQFGAFQERIKDESHNFVGNGGDGIAAIIRPDVNKYLPNGSLNPNFGAPFISAVGPQVYANPINNVTAKANIAYQADFSKDKGWTKWVGRQRLLGYMEYNRKENAPNALRYHDQIDPHTASSLGLVAANVRTAPNSNFQANVSGSANSVGSSNAATPQMRYYLGDKSGSNVDYASQRPDFSDSLTYYRYGSSVSTPYTYGWNADTVTMATPYFSQGMQQAQLRTKGYVYQGFFLKDRILPIYGERTDSKRIRNNIAETTGSRDEYNWLIDESYLSTFTGSPWLVMNKATGSTMNTGKTRTKGLVVKPFNWLSLRYNESSSFKPDDYAIDFSGNPLSNPYGTTKDYGFGLSLFHDKLYLRLTRFESLTVNARTSSISAVAGRITNMDFDTDPAKDGVKMDVEDFLIGEYAKIDGVTDASTGTTAQITKWTTAAHQNMGLTDQLIADLRQYAKVMTSDAVAKGYELEMTFNPNRNWTMKLTGSQTEAINQNLSRTWLEYKNARLEYWKNLKSPYLTPAVTNTDGTVTAAHYIEYWTNVFPTNAIARDYFTGTVDAPMKLNYALEGKPVPQNRKYKFNYMTSYKLSGLTSNKYLRNVSVGGRVSWEDRGAIGFGPAAPDADGVIRAYDANTVYYDNSHTYCDLFGGYDFKIANDKVRGRVQLNVRNVFEGGRLQAFTARPDGVASRFRIVDPREFVLTVSFDL